MGNRFFGLNSCRRVSLMCYTLGGKCVTTKAQEIAFNRLERMLCRMAKESCKKYIKERKRYRYKRMFKRK